MPLYKYKAADKDNRTINGLVEAADEELAADLLKEKGLVIISLKEKGGFGAEIFLGFLNKIKIKDLVIFSRQFSVLISASVSMVKSLRILADQTENPKLKTVILEIAEEVDGGARLSDALAKRPNIFSNFFVSVIKSGESSGKLDEVLNYLADEIEKDYDMTSKMKGAMIYPAFVLSGLGVVGIVMMVFVVPKLTDVLASSGAELPLATRILMWTSNFLAHSWIFLLIALIAAGIGIKFFASKPFGRRFIDAAKLKLPIFGNLFKKIYLVRFTRSLNTLILGGVSITKGLKITAEVVDNSVYKNLIERTIKDVEDGNSISGTLETSKEIPKMVSQMISIGEKTGKLDIILDRISKFYAREIDNLVANLMTLMEPIIMVILGIAVGIMVAAIILPMYNMATSY